jgi:serine protease Do
MKRFSLVATCLMLGAVIGALVGHSFLQGQLAPTVRGPGAAAVPVIPKELSSYRDIVKRVLPAVVSIEAQSTTGKRRPLRPDDMQLPDDLRFFRPGERVAEDGPQRIGFGSGFLVTAKGVIVTNNHVVESADQVQVTLRDGRKFISKDVKTDPKTDLAIVRIDGKGALPFLEFGNSNEMEIGDRVLAVGAPFGLTGSVTHGIVSARGRSLRMNMYEDFLQTDAAINPGNSGGPLVNLEGQVIGINTAIKSRSGGFQGVGLAIASNLGKNVVEQLLRNGVVRRGYLGVQIKDVEDEEEAKKLGLTEAKGVLVTRVFEDGPGAKGGLKSGDVILSIDGKAVKDGRDLQSVVAGLPVGKDVAVQVIRERKPRALTVHIAEQPATFGTGRLPLPGVEKAGVALAGLGVSVVELTAEWAEALGLKEGAKGVVISRVEPAGLAAAAGLRRGLVISAVNGRAVESTAAAANAARAGSVSAGVRVRITRSNGSSFEVLLRAGGDE